ncbi:hypothetical protein ACFL5Z_18350 [Planctomycetota bacterium]
MNGKLKTLLLLVLSGLLLGISPGTRLYSANDEPAGPHHHGHIESAAVQFLLVHVEREMLEEHLDESNILTLDSISLETIDECIHAEDGAEIISQMKLTVVNEVEAEMTIVENEKRKAKNSDEENNEQDQREAEVFVWLEPEILDGNKLAAQFTYKRSVAEEGFFAGEEAEEEEGIEHKFEISSGIVLQAGQACIVGANLNEGMAKLLIMKTDLR